MPESKHMAIGEGRTGDAGGVEVTGGWGTEGWRSLWRSETTLHDPGVGAA